MKAILSETPRLHFLHCGLLAAMLGTTAEHIAKNRAVPYTVIFDGKNGVLTLKSSFVFSGTLANTET